MLAGKHAEARDADLHRAPLVAYVSATNAATAFKEMADPEGHVIDVISFLPASRDEYMSAYKQFQVRGRWGL